MREPNGGPATRKRGSLGRSRRWPGIDGRQSRLRLLAWFIWLACLMLTLSGAILLYLNRPFLDQLRFPGFYAGVALAIGYGTVGLLIVANRPRHPIGWLFMSIAMPAAVTAFAQMYAIYGLITVGPAGLPGARLMGWLQIWVLYLAFPAPVALLAMLFPDGRLPSRRWRLVAWLAGLSTIFLVLRELFNIEPVQVYATARPIRLPMSNPTGSEAMTAIINALGSVWILAVITLPIGLFAPIFRFRRARGAERQQLKWFVYFGAFTLLLIPLTFVGGEVIGDLVLAVSIIVLPAATAMAILRHRLYDIDLIIKRTLVYGVLTTLLALVYFCSVALLQAVFSAVSGQRSTVALVLSTLLIAALFTPLRRRVQDLIDRRFFRQKYDAARTLAAFARTARDEVDLDALAAEMMRVVQETMQPATATLWLAEGNAKRQGSRGAKGLT